jgi:integrase/recombinase XerC
MTNQTHPPSSQTLEAVLAAFVRALQGSNRSPATVRAYQTDVSQFLTWLHHTNMVAQLPTQVERADLTDYLAALAGRSVSGVSRARKLAALREYFRFALANGQLTSSPVEGIVTPKKEPSGRTSLRVDEYTRLLSLAGAQPRDYAILQVFLQTGVRVSELCGLRLGDVDLAAGTLTVSGKGMVRRMIELERKGIQAVKSYLAVRPQTVDDHLFLNQYGEPLGERGVRKLVAKYLRSSGITKKVSPHSLRHTFATYKAERGVTAFQLQQWMGHRNVNTTQIYVHLGRQNARKVMEGTSL